MIDIFIYFFLYDSLKISQTIPIFKRTNELNAILYALLFFFISIKFIVLYILKKKKRNWRVCSTPLVFCLLRSKRF